MQCHMCSYYFINNKFVFPDTWAKVYRKFPNSNQDTNNAIESYHGYLKQRYLKEINNACHINVDWLIYTLMVELYYNHMQHLKEAGFIRPLKVEEQLTASKHRAKQIPDEDCVGNEQSHKEYWVHRQNNDT